MTRQQLTEMLPARPKCSWDKFWDELLKEQVISMIFPDYLEPKQYEIVNRVECNANSHSFTSTLKIKDENEWFFVETVENDNGYNRSITHNINSTINNNNNSEDSSDSQKKVGEFDIDQRGESALRQIAPKPSVLVTSGNLNLPDTMIEQFLASIDVSTQTKINYRYGLGKLQGYSQIRNDWYTPQGLIAFKKHLLDSGLDTSSTNTHLIATRRMFTYLFNHGLISFNPMDELKNYRQKKSRREAFSKEEVIKLLDTIKTSDKPMSRSQDKHKNILFRDYTMTRLIIKTGLREISVANAMFKDIGFKDNQYILWVLVKNHTDKDEYVVLTDNLVDDLNKCNVYSGQGYIFVGHGNKNSNQQLTRRHIRKIITEYMIQAGIKTPANCVHALRNFFIQETIKNGARLEQTQLSVHHSDPKTTMGYAGDLDRIQNPAESFITGI